MKCVVMGTKIRVDELMFEVTRKCNMMCPHCLRGDPEDVDMTTNIVDAVLGHVSGVHSVTFTGGEPTLNVPIIKYVFERMDAAEIDPCPFWMATNGKVYSSDLVNLLITRWAKTVQVWDEQFNAIAVSHGDGFHDPIPTENLLKYKALRFYDPCKEGPRDPDTLIHDGRAQDNGLERRYIDPRSDNPVTIDADGEMRFEGALYISANGNVGPDCDMSYDRVDDDPIGNVLGEPLVDILKRYNDSFEGE